MSNGQEHASPRHARMGARAWRELVRRPAVLSLLLLLLLGTALLLALRGPKSTVEKLTITVVERYPHDSNAFTQGLLIHDGYLYESTGLVGASSLREVVPTTGEVVRVRPIAAPYFGEGLTLVGDELLMLTWQHGTLFRFDRATFEPTGQQEYEGEGWGLCYDGSSLWMTDGSSTLFERDPVKFSVLSEVKVTRAGKPVTRLNELECVGGRVYANVWQTDTIVRIDPTTGEVEANIDASALKRELGRLSSDAVLNGVAYSADDDLFYVTGKLWPTMYAVRFEPKK